MTQNERLLWLIHYLLNESEQYRGMEIPNSEEERFRLYRSLVNVRLPKPIEEDYLTVEDAYLQEEITKKGVTHMADLTPVEEDLYIWQGDITLLDVDAIVNAANSQMLGCFAPCHACIDNCIHTFAGVRLRLKCNEIMQAQGFNEPTGQAKITPAYNLPSRYVLHTVGPIVRGSVTNKDEALLASSYRECLKLADENRLSSVAFCCVSTGVFSFPNDRAAEIAVNTVKEYKAQTGTEIKVIFNVFKDYDLALYQALLGE